MDPSLTQLLEVSVLLELNVARLYGIFHRVFLGNVRYFGRIHEAGFIGVWKMLSGKWFSDMLLGLKMFRKGKMRMIPERIQKPDEVGRLFKKGR